MPNAAGLYALHGSIETWQLLGLGAAPDARPLYVGKAERSLASRDLQTHFRTGSTGQSTVRRSFAALLRDELPLRAVPRNANRPDAKPTHFGLDRAADARLTAWMLDRLELAVWAKPADCAKLSVVESEVIRRWGPPLNIQGNVGSPWIAKIRKARQIMVADVGASVLARRTHSR
ncbi:MAG: hypothetical protein IPL61_19640 [Myxococcales bacterium]|nr:hypothetical protein [Myxococcales bacterium]